MTCPHNNISLPTTSDPQTVCADCGAVIEDMVAATYTIDAVCDGYVEVTISGKHCYWIGFTTRIRDGVKLAIIGPEGRVIANRWGIDWKMMKADILAQFQRGETHG
jgi:hypothetical protein